MTARLLLLLFLVALLPACATDPGNPFGDADAEERRGRGELHQVWFEVSCDECTIRWSVGPYAGSEADTAVWSRRVAVRVRPEQPVRARLAAAPMPGAGPVSRVRIRVDGDVAAEASGEASGAMDALRPLTVETLVPPPEGRRIVATGPGAPSPAASQDACDGPPTTAGMRACQQERLTRATEELTGVLEELGTLLDEPRAELLHRSQRAWEEHRAAYCRFVSARYEGGSLQPVLLTSCFARVTSARVRELRKQLRLEREQGGG